MYGACQRCTSSDQICSELLELLEQCRAWKSAADESSAFFLGQIIERLDDVSQQLIQKKDADPDPSPIKKLSAREREVLAHVANGFTNREIASALSVSEKTIEYHLKSIFEKTHSSRRTEAVSFALKHGWI